MTIGDKISINYIKRVNSCSCFLHFASSCALQQSIYLRVYPLQITGQPVHLSPSLPTVYVTVQLHGAHLTCKPNPITNLKSLKINLIEPIISEN